jgi:hypothetical protein
MAPARRTTLGRFPLNPLPALLRYALARPALFGVDAERDQNRPFGVVILLVGRLGSLSLPPALKRHILELPPTIEVFALTLNGKDALIVVRLAMTSSSRSTR